MAGFMDHFLILLHTCHLYCRTAIDWMTGHGRTCAERIDAVWQRVSNNFSVLSHVAPHYEKAKAELDK